MEKVELARFNFVEPDPEGYSRNVGHTYFVTTDVCDAVEHFLKKINGDQLIYMTISSLNDNVCIAKSYGLNKNKTGPEIIRIDDHQGLDGRKFEVFTKEFRKIMEKRLKEAN